MQCNVERTSQVVQLYRAKNNAELVSQFITMTTVTGLQLASTSVTAVCNTPCA